MIVYLRLKIELLRSVTGRKGKGCRYFMMVMTELFS